MPHKKSDSEHFRQTGPDVPIDDKGAHKPLPQSGDIETGGDDSRNYAQNPDVDAHATHTNPDEYKKDGLAKTSQYSVEKKKHTGPADGKNPSNCDV